MQSHVDVDTESSSLLYTVWNAIMTYASCWSWKRGRNGTRLVKKLNGGMLALLCVSVKVQICI